MCKRVCLLAIAVLFSVLFVGRTHAQTTNGLLTGAVTDPSGAVVVGAQIEIINQDTGLRRTTSSRATG